MSKCFDEERFIHKFIKESFDGGNKHKWNKAVWLLNCYIDM